MNTQATKNILIYGDSYTFGKIPGGLRYDSKTRFAGVLQSLLGTEYDVIEEGLRGRMLSGESRFFLFRDGLEQFGPILASHLPLDLVVLSLGTNDANAGPKEILPDVINGDLQAYVEKIAWWCEHISFPKPKILLVAPPKIYEKESYKAFGEIFKGADEKIKNLPRYTVRLQKHMIMFPFSTLEP